MRPEPAPSEPPRVHLRTLGCRLNQAESDEIRASLALCGYDTDTSTRPDVIVVNTCAVTAEATKASRKLIRRTIAEFPDARVLVTGCYAVVDPDGAGRIPGVGGVLADRDRDVVRERIAGEFTASPSPGDPPTTIPGLLRSGPPTSPVVPRWRTPPRVNLKVQTGCDEACSFCIVPLTRGGLSSRTVRSVVETAQRLVATGARELVLTGVHLGKFGWDRAGRETLAGLIDRLCALEDLRRLRLSSIEASQIDERLLRVIAGRSKVCPHLHLPMQTGDPAVWEAMRRPGTLGDYLRTVELVRRFIPDVTITTDVMVGFPGESDRSFSSTLRVVEEIGFRRLHVFRFSARPGTAAASMPEQVPPELRRERGERLRVLGDRLRLDWHRSRRGEEVEVLVEQSAGTSPARLSGFTADYLRVRSRGPAGLVGSAVKVLVTSAGIDGVEGETVGELPVLQHRRRDDSVGSGSRNRVRARLS